MRTTEVYELCICSCGSHSLHLCKTCCNQRGFHQTNWISYVEQTKNPVGAPRSHVSGRSQGVWKEVRKRGLLPKQVPCRRRTDSRCSTLCSVVAFPFGNKQDNMCNPKNMYHNKGYKHTAKAVPEVSVPADRPASSLQEGLGQVWPGGRSSGSVPGSSLQTKVVRRVGLP